MFQHKKHAVYRSTYLASLYRAFQFQLLPFVACCHSSALLPVVSVSHNMLPALIVSVPRYVLHMHGSLFMYKHYAHIYTCIRAVQVPRGTPNI